MSGTTINNPPLAFNPFAYNAKQQNYANFSPATLYVSPLEDYTSADLTSDSAPSPGSPVSPMFAAPYALPMDNDWLSWGDKAQQVSNNPFVRPNDPYDSPILSSVPARSVSVSPAINPLDLTNNNGLSDDIVPFGQDGLNDNLPLFQTAPFVSSRPQQQTVVAPAEIQIKQEPRQQQQQQQAEPRRSTRASQQQQQQQQQQRSLKRKSTTSSSSSRSSASPPPAASRRKENNGASPPTGNGNGVLGPKKTAHNMIEKRYRTNLNDKIAALRDAVPALRVMVNRAEQDDDECAQVKREGSLDDQEDLGGLAPAHKLNKATILSKATEYISHLERKNQVLASENANLRDRVEGFEMMMMSRGDERDCLWA